MQSETVGYTVEYSSADLSDKAKLERLLQPIPKVDGIRRRLGTSFNAMIYDAEARRDYWVVGCGPSIITITFSNISMEEAARERTKEFGLPERAA